MTEQQRLEMVLDMLRQWAAADDDRRPGEHLVDFYARRVGAAEGLLGVMLDLIDNRGATLPTPAPASGAWRLLLVDRDGDERLLPDTFLADLETMHAVGAGYMRDDPTVVGYFVDEAEVTP